MQVAELPNKHCTKIEVGRNHKHPGKGYFLSAWKDVFPCVRKLSAEN